MISNFNTEITEIGTDESGWKQFFVIISVEKKKLIKLIRNFNERIGGQLNSQFAILLYMSEAPN